MLASHWIDFAQSAYCNIACNRAPNVLVSARTGCGRRSGSSRCGGCRRRCPAAPAATGPARRPSPLTKRRRTKGTRTRCCFLVFKLSFRLNRQRGEASEPSLPAGATAAGHVFGQTGQLPTVIFWYELSDSDGQNLIHVCRRSSCLRLSSCVWTACDHRNSHTHGNQFPTFEFCTICRWSSCWRRTS